MQYSVVRIHHGQLKLLDEAQIRRPLEATWILFAVCYLEPIGRRKSEKHYPITVKDISCVKVVSLHVRCYGGYADHDLLIEPYGRKVNVKSPYEINLGL